MISLRRLKAGDRVAVRVGRNLVHGEVVEVRPDRAMVRSDSSGKVFRATRIEEVSEEPSPAQAVPVPEPAGAQDPAREVVPDDERPRTAIVPPPRRLSLVEAAIEVLRREKRPLNTRELVELAVERGLWKPRKGSTPEQSLYGAFFLEIRSGESPRIRKATARGKFELAQAIPAKSPSRHILP